MKKTPVKLNLGCGQRKIYGFVNVDADATVVPDLLTDAFTLPGFKPNSVDVVYACHLLEHSGRKTYQLVLARWFEVLKPGGVLRVAVPDIRAGMEFYLANGNLAYIFGLLWGGQNSEFDWHGFGWDETTLTADLKATGFKDVRRYDWRETEHAHVDDYSHACLPAITYAHIRPGGTIGGKQVSLNLETTKP